MVVFKVLVPEEFEQFLPFSLELQGLRSSLVELLREYPEGLGIKIEQCETFVLDGPLPLRKKQRA